MAKLIFSFIALSTSMSLALGLSCGQPATEMRPARKQDGQRIVGGQPARPNSHPWIVSLQQWGNHFCGGSLIDIGDDKETDIVITAAHCLYGGVDMDGFTVVAGVTNLRDPRTRQTVMVYDYIYHEDYDPDIVINDIAVLKLATPIVFKSPAVLPVCLPEPDEEVADDTTGIVAGWGMKNETVFESSNALMQVGLPTIDSETCIDEYAAIDIYVFPELMLCAGFPDGKKDACEGDSGGPFVFKEARGYTLQGVVSFGIGCAHNDTPGIYTRVSYYIDWINDVVMELTPGASIFNSWTDYLGGAVSGASGYLGGAISGASGYLGGALSGVSNYFGYGKKSGS